MRHSARFVGFGYVLVLLTASTLYAQDEPAARNAEPSLEQRAEKLDVNIPKWMERADVPGLTLGGVWDGEFVGVASWGVANAMLGTPVTETTVFAAASLTKPVVALLVLQLVDEGVLALDQPLADVYLLPELAKDPRAHKITVRMILSHSSGLPNWSYDRPLAIEFDPGTRFQYSGEGFVWLARVLEKATGKPLQQLAETRVFEPLGMKSSSLVWQERFLADFAFGHGENGEPREPQMSDEPNAAASMLTTSRDYARFLAACLEGGGLGEDLQRQWFEPQVEVAPGVSWGLGWGLQQTERGRALFQWGDNSGYKAFVTADLASRGGVVVFTNSDNGMSMMREVVTVAMAADQPGLDWLNYEGFNSPRREVRRILERVLENEGTQATIDEYHSLKRRYPPQAFQEGLLNALGYSLIGEERFVEAIEIFALNVQEYPEAFNPYDSLGEAYMRYGDVPRAIENYERSIELNPDNENGVRMLAELRKKLE